MNHALSENICKLRKANHMTQQQLADALGVSFAAVSKWERGAATPELSLITDMADLFDVSADVLIRYTLRNNKKDAIVERLKQYVHDRESQDALSDAEKALQRYPNCFEIVYYSADNYYVRGIYQQQEAYLKRALSLFNHACHLIEQNTDPKISEISLWKVIADIHISLGEYETGLQILKTHNPCRLNDDEIGMTLASSCNDSEGALPYLSRALMDLYASQMRIVIGYLNVYYKAGDYESAAALLDWALSFYPGLKKPGSVCCMDKAEATLWVLRASVSLEQKESDCAETYLRRAKALAQHFDSAPSYDITGLRFVSDDTVASTVDNLGETAMDGIEKVLLDVDSKELTVLWRVIQNEA